MKIVATGLLTLLVTAAVSAGSIGGYKLLTTHSEPDTVVAVIARCEQRISAEKTFDMSGPQCEPGDRIVHTSATTSYAIINSRLQLTIRTSKGSTYQIDVPVDTSVNVGDNWPK